MQKPSLYTIQSLLLSSKFLYFKLGILAEKVKCVTFTTVQLLLVVLAISELTDKDFAPCILRKIKKSSRKALKLKMTFADVTVATNQVILNL